MTQDDNGVTLTLRVQPKASRDELLWQDETLKLRVTAPPVDGKANLHVRKFLAKQFGVAPSRVTIVGGETGRHKRVRIEKPQRCPHILSKFVSIVGAS